MAKQGKPLLVRNGGYRHLAHLFGKRNVQYHIENFDRIVDARRKLGDSFSIELAEGKHLPVEALEQMNRIANGHGPQGSKHLKRLSALRLIVGGAQGKKKGPPPALTEAGQSLLAMAL